MENDEASCQPLDAPILCANNCGFFGSATTMNLCSRCYREVIAKQAKETEAAAAISAVRAQLHNNREGLGKIEAKLPAMSSTNALGYSATIDAAVGDSASGSGTKALPSQQALQKPNRCASCNKKVGLTGFKCRCGGLFCSSHRYNDKHDCTFDYKAVVREALTKANPVVKADKIDKI